MLYPPYRTIAEFLVGVGVGLANGRDMPQVATALAQYGYDAAKLDQGAALLAKAEVLDAEQAQAYGAQMAATAELNTVWKTAAKTYATHRKLARIALRDDEQAQVALLLNQRKPQALSAWLAQAELFYTNALDNGDVLAALGQYQVTGAVLTEGATAVAQITRLRASQQQRKADARKATKQRNDALRALHQWHRDFRAIAKIALEGEQLLESLGLKITV